MTVLTGAISRDGAPLPQWLRDGLVSNLSRHRDDVAQVIGGDQWLLASIDVGALGGETTYVHSEDAAFVMAGEPLAAAAVSAPFSDRKADAVALFRDLANRASTTLRAATGVFCCAFYSPYEHRLTIVTDKLGIRPIYYLVTPEFAAFTSALRIFEATGLTSRGIDLRGTYETCAFGFPLGNRTVYEGVRTICAAEVIHFTKDAETHDRYFHWDRLQPSASDEVELLNQLADTFVSGVKRRNGRDKVALSFLSGGLDSRAIVAVLRDIGVNVVTVNFAPPGTQDRVFANLAAETLGSSHHELDVPISSASDIYRQKQISECIESLPSSAIKPDRPHCIWSGDGGSVGLGHVYITEKAIDSFEHGGMQCGVRDFLQDNRLFGASTIALTKEFRARSRTWHVEGVLEQLAALEDVSGSRALHLFLMFNDQRRHMAKHFESIDINRLEFQLPFFDSNFIEIILRAPVRRFLRHALYHKWLKAMSPLAASVPWQTYPNHEPCPIPFTGQLRYQFSDYYDKLETRKLARTYAQRAITGFCGPHFPHHLVNRVGYALAIVTCLLGSNSYSHAVRVGSTFVQCWQQSHGRNSVSNR